MIAPHDIVPVILTGHKDIGLKPIAGRGRGMPLLRAQSRRSYFQDALLRSAVFDRAIVICAPEDVDLVRRQTGEIGLRTGTIIAAHEDWGSAALVALAGFHLKNQGKRMLVMAADHLVPSFSVFQSCILEIADYADGAMLLLGGSDVTRARVQDAYIQYAPNVQNTAVHKVIGYFDRPEPATARILARAPNSWRFGGMFIARPRDYLGALDRFAPDIYKSAQRAYFSARMSANIVYPAAIEFDKIDSVSYGVSILERCSGMMAAEVQTRSGDIHVWRSFLKS